MIVDILQVHLCEAIRINEFLPDEYTLNRTLSRSSMLVAVKMLRPTADDRARYAYLLLWGAGIC